MRVRKLKNPFLLTGFYGKEYFCNRENELNKLRDHFENERNVVLYSWRRFGKTALIKCFTSELETEKRSETVYVDLLGTRNATTALQYIVQAVYDRYGKTGSGISLAFQKLLGSTGFEISFDPVTGIPRISLDFRPKTDTEKSLKAIGDFIAARKKRVLVVLDEFQQITQYSSEDGESLFRSWMQSFPEIRFIFCGSHRHMMVSMFSEQNRPFYLSSQLMQLNSIDKVHYMEFIRDHFNHAGKGITVAAVDRIFEWSRMQTYCIQLICNKLYGHFNQVSMEEVEIVVCEILDQEGPFFSEYTRLLSEMQWNVLKAVAQEEPLSTPLSNDFIGKYQLGATSSVSTALDMLKRNELIIFDEGKYLVHEVLLARWLQSL
jgi:hypothetical protein